MQWNELADEENDNINKGLDEGPTHLSKFIKRARLSDTPLFFFSYLCTLEICLYSLFALVRLDAESKISC